MRRPWLLLPLVAGGLWLLVRVVPFTRGIACGSVVVRVTGRLVDAGGRGPVAGAYVLTLPEASWAEQPDTIARCKGWNAESAGHPSLLAAATTDAERRFDALVGVPFSVSYVNGVAQGPEEPDPRAGVEALWIETTAGAAPVVVAVAGGTLERQATDGRRDEVWATWDLGPVSVPSAR